MKKYFVCGLYYDTNWNILDGDFDFFEFDDVEEARNAFAQLCNEQDATVRMMAEHEPDKTKFYILQIEEQYEYPDGDCEFIDIVDKFCIERRINMTVTEEYKDFLKSTEFSATDLVRLFDFVNKMASNIDERRLEGVHCLQGLDEEIRPLRIAIENISTDCKCPRCGAYLFLSDLPQYNYTCIYCEENFYEMEVK